MDANITKMIEGELARLKAGIPTPQTAAEWDAFIADERARTRAFNAALAKSAAEQRVARQATYAAAESQLAATSGGHKFEGTGARCTRCRVRKGMHS